MLPYFRIFQTGSGRPRTSGRKTTLSVTRTPLCVDDAAFNALVTNMESFGVCHAEAFQPALISAAYLAPHGQQGAEPEEPSELAPPPPPPKSPLAILTQSENQKLVNAAIAMEKTETLLEWFDHTVEEELKKHKDKSHSPTQIDANLMNQIRERAKLATAAPKSSSQEREAEAGVSTVNILEDMKSTSYRNELTEAVEKLATAEAMIQYAGAVEAAEAAAEAAPPGLAEEFAAAGARVFQSEITSVVHETLPGDRPIEVVGYIGLTRPTKPKLRND